MQVISDAKELEKHTYIKTRNPNIFPKKERLGLAQRMMNEASDLVADLMEANDLLLTDPQERELRYRAQRSALRNCRKLIHHIRQPVGYALFFRAGSANNARNVRNDGTLNRNNAYNGNNGLRPASMDSPTY